MFKFLFYYVFRHDIYRKYDSWISNYAGDSFPFSRLEIEYEMILEDGRVFPVFFNSPRSLMTLDIEDDEIVYSFETISPEDIATEFLARFNENPKDLFFSWSGDLAFLENIKIKSFKEKNRKIQKQIGYAYFFYDNIWSFCWWNRILKEIAKKKMLDDAIIEAKLTLETHLFNE